MTPKNIGKKILKTDYVDLNYTTADFSLVVYADNGALYFQSV